MVKRRTSCGHSAADRNPNGDCRKRASVKRSEAVTIAESVRDEAADEAGLTSVPGQSLHCTRGTTECLPRSPSRPSDWYTKLSGHATSSRPQGR